MKVFIEQILDLKRTEIGIIIKMRLHQFQELKTMPNEAWFSELCFCILTANAKSRTACQIQNELGYNGFASASLEELTKTIKRNKHRFHNTKARFIIEARMYRDIIKETLMQFKTEKEMRLWLQQNIKGYGFKEASHFLRNIGFTNLAILDRHILSILEEQKLIKERPKQLNQKNYEAIEKLMHHLGNKTNMNQAELDLYLWYLKTGNVLK